MAAIEPIATLPVFFKLGGKRALLAGGSPPAAWKAEVLAAAGALVVICAPEPCAAVEECVAALGGKVQLLRRVWTQADFSGAAIAIGALEDEAAEAFYHAAHAAGVPVNVIDVPRFCDFQFGTIIGRSPLVIGISTDGAAPVFGQALRARIEALLPAGIGLWAKAAKDWRPAVQDLALNFAARRRFWEVFADRALAGTERGPEPQDRDACLTEALAVQTSRQGRIVLVGVGPGAPDLVTLRAVRALQSADIILHEAGVAPAILALGRREARRLPEAETLAATATEVAKFYRAGAGVAWVGLGNPKACALWAPRLALLSAEDISPETVEGLACARCPEGCPCARL